MLSRRAAQLPPSSTAALDAHAKQLAAEGVDVINLTSGELAFPTPQEASDGGIKAITDGRTRYTAVAGIPPLRQAVAERLTRAWQAPYTGEEIIITNGAKQALANVFVALLDPGDEVIIQAPHWVSFPHMVTLAGGTPVILPTGPGTGSKMTPQAVAERITPRTKVLLVNSPSNPTGVVYDRRELAALAEVALGAGLTIVSDEIYGDLVYQEGLFAAMASLGPDVRAATITVGGLSKTFAMTGWRVGFAAGPKPVISAMAALQGHTTSAASTISQHAALAVLLDEPVAELDARRAELDERRRALCAGLAGLPGLRLDVEPMGAFFAFVEVSGTYGLAWQGETIRSAADFARHLLSAARVAVVPGADFGAPDHVRISYVDSPQVIGEALARIRAFLTEAAQANVGVARH
ncbi:pyridoxal phosphate-dependent aminotransferase [Sphaerisporangium sp. NPDC005289]|uniref:pyridoxal phosphate-dependent aminotransferase n=1 Tax=Sphaerisporangium sp. NPDC005289 TaxID=3155247 RepID=UPI0033A8342C